MTEEFEDRLRRDLSSIAENVPAGTPIDPAGTSTRRPLTRPWLAAAAGVLITVGAVAWVATVIDGSQSDVLVTPRVSTAPSSAEPPVRVDVSARWDRIEPTFQHRRDLSEQERADVADGWNPVEIEGIEWALGQYFAFGESVGRATVWRSPDLRDFEVVWSDPAEPLGCCRRHIRLEHLAATDEKVLIGGVGQADGTDRSFLLASDDGTEWREIEAPVFTAPGAYLSQLLVLDEVVVANVSSLVDSRIWPETPVRSEDLVSWERIAAIDAGVDQFGDAYGLWYSSAAGRLFATSSDWTAEGPFTRMWQSNDAGSTFHSILDEPTTIRASVPVGDAIVGTSFGDIDSNYWWGEGVVLPDPGRVAVVNESGVTLLAPNTGLWGDAEFSFRDHAIAPDGSTWAIVARRQRANPHFCFDDVTTCQTPEAALVHNTGTGGWVEVPLPGFLLAPEWLTVNENGDITLAYEERHRDGNGRSVVVHRHTGPGSPSVQVPEHYPAPVPPVEFWDGQPLTIGESARFAWGQGGCAGFWMNDQEWIPEELPDPAWPTLEVFISDGPSGYVFGVVEQIDATTIEFSIDGTVEAVLHPREEPRTEFCG